VIKPFSTKLGRPIPPEFEPSFITGGWSLVNQMFGKRASLRFYTVSGPERLRLLRLAAVRKQRAKG